MTEKQPDLFEQFKVMSIPALAEYAQAFNITVTNGVDTGIIIDPGYPHDRP